MSDYIIRGMAADKQVRFFAANTKDLVEKARRIHNTSPIATAALGRLMTGTAMMGSMCKNDSDIVTVQIKGDGPMRGLVVTSDAKARVKGYVYNKDVMLPPNAQGKLDVGGAIGNGVLTVIKDLGLKEPYSGQTNLITGEIAEDFANYYYISEQKNTAVALGVLVDKNGVKSAGGFIVTSMPDATEDELFILENRLKEAKPISQMLDEKMSLLDIAKDITGDENIKVLKDERKPEYKCNCSKEKMKAALKTVGKEELTKILEEDKKAEIVCHFCNKKYEFSEEDLKKIMTH